MKSFRNPKYIERYEDVFFQLETPLNTGNPGNNRSQKKDGYRFVVDNTGEVTPFDWYNARISVGFKVQTMQNANIAAEDHNGIVNGSHSLIHDFDVRLNGKMVYDLMMQIIVLISRIYWNIVQDMLNRQQQMIFSIWIQAEVLKNDQLKTTTIKDLLQEKHFWVYQWLSIQKYH